MGGALPEVRDVPQRPGAEQNAASAPAARRRIFSFPSVLIASLAYLVFLLARRNVADPDLWWHLRNAQQLLSTGRLPLADTYSFTAPGAPVLPFEWLSELPYYFAFKLAGLTGVFVLVFALCSAIVLGVYRLCCLASHDLKNSFIAALGAAVLTTISMGARPLLFGWLCLISLMILLEQVRHGHWSRLVFVPPLFCLWINLHGSWPMGVAVLGAFIVSGLVEGDWGQVHAVRWSAAQLRNLALAALCSAAALFINPFGDRLVAYPFRVLFGSAGPSFIQEFAAVDFHSAWGRVALLMIAAVISCALFSRVQWTPYEVALAGMALYFSLSYQRFFFLAGILLAPVFARRLKLMTAYDRTSDRPMPNAVALGVIAVLFAVSVPRPAQFQNPVKYPGAALAYMDANGIQGRIFHEWVWGGYLIWNAPQRKVFIDGRGDPYGTAVTGDYLAAAANQHPQAVFDKYGIDLVLMPPENPMVQALAVSPQWSVLFHDENSILLRRAPPPEPASR